MAPEQAAADPHADHRCDLYAVGTLAYEMLTGRPPFTGNTPQQVLMGKVTYVHRRLWPALIRPKSKLGAAALASIREVHTPTGKHVLQITPFRDRIFGGISALPMMWCVI